LTVIEPARTAKNAKNEMRHLIIVFPSAASSRARLATSHLIPDPAGGPDPQEGDRPVRECDPTSTQRNNFLGPKQN
jgi:hypothetical protein